MSNSRLITKALLQRWTQQKHTLHQYIIEKSLGYLPSTNFILSHCDVREKWSNNTMLKRIPAMPERSTECETSGCGYVHDMCRSCAEWAVFFITIVIGYFWAISFRVMWKQLLHNLCRHDLCRSLTSRTGTRWIISQRLIHTDEERNQSRHVPRKMYESWSISWVSTYKSWSWINRWVWRFCSGWAHFIHAVNQ